MSNKVFTLVSVITTAVCMAASGLVDFFNPPCETAILASIPLFEGFVIGVCANFKEPSPEKKG